MTETLQTSPPEIQQETDAISISFKGNAVNLTIANGVSAWQALGLIKTAETILLAQYNTSSVANTKESE